jgi:hypothetical protein
MSSAEDGAPIRVRTGGRHRVSLDRGSSLEVGEACEGEGLADS